MTLLRRDFLPDDLEPAADELAAACSEQRFVVDHTAKPEIRERHIDAWARGIAALSRRGNVCFRLFGMVTEADWPVCTLAGKYGDVLQVAMRHAARLSPRDQAQSSATMQRSSTASDRSSF